MYTETRYPEIFHSLDVWHKSKKLQKVLAKVSRMFLPIIISGKMKGMEKLLQWSSNFVNHLWYCCRTTDGNALALKVCF